MYGIEEEQAERVYQRRGRETSAQIGAWCMVALIIAMIVLIITAAADRAWAKDRPPATATEDPSTDEARRVTLAALAHEVQLLRAQLAEVVGEIDRARAMLAVIEYERRVNEIRATAQRRYVHYVDPGINMPVYPSGWNEAEAWAKSKIESLGAPPTWPTTGAAR